MSCLGLQEGHATLLCGGHQKGMNLQHLDYEPDKLPITLSRAHNKGKCKWFMWVVDVGSDCMH